jgi:hypothetical protein
VWGGCGGTVMKDPAPPPTGCTLGYIFQFSRWAHMSIRAFAPFRAASALTEFAGQTLLAERVRALISGVAE